MTSFENSVAILVLGALFTFLGTAFWWYRKKRDAMDQENHNRLEILEKRLAEVNTVVTPIYTMMQKLLIDKLTNFHTPELDILLVKVLSGALSETEEPRLFQLLEATASNINKTLPIEERYAAAMLPMIMILARREKWDINGGEIVTVLLPVKKNA